MSGFCRVYPKSTRCDEDLNAQAGVRECESFTACLPFGASLVFDGECLTFTSSTAVPDDGVYDKLVIQDGCIVEVRKDDLPVYTPPPCTPVPVPCDDTGSGTVVLNPDVANLLYWDSSSRLTGKLFYENSGDITLSGNGTSSSPLRIDANITPTTISMVSTTTDVLLLTNPATNQFVINMATIDNAQVGTHAGFEIDRYGRVVRYTDPGSSGVADIQGTAGNIEVSNSQGIYRIDLPSLHTGPQQVQAGEQALTIDLQGRVSQIVNNPSSVGNRFSSVISGTWTTNLFSFTSTASGRMRISYKGKVGELTSGSGAGVVPLSSDFQLLVNTQSISAFAVIDENLQIIGIEALTPNAYTAGDHTVALILANSISNVVFLDVDLCQ